MPLTNRVTPLGELIATPARGLVYGNRGCLHDDAGRIRRHHAVRRWIACQLEFRGWRRGALMRPGRFTELFFLDEATAFAAGHRPCALCRYADYRRLVDRWDVRHAGVGRDADAIDRVLHAERLDDRGAQRHHARAWRALPDAAMVQIDGAPWLVRGAELRRWTPGEYAQSRPRPVRGEAEVITPPSLLALLADGWTSLVPLLHPSAL